MSDPTPASVTAALDLDSLKALAKKATRGPWEARIEVDNGVPLQWWVRTMTDDDCQMVIERCGRKDHGADAAFIAACDPTTILELCRRLRAAGDGHGGV
jgi:hypothetical protein